MDFINRTLEVKTLHISEFLKLRNMVANAIGIRNCKIINLFRLLLIVIITIIFPLYEQIIVFFSTNNPQVLDHFRFGKSRNQEMQEENCANIYNYFQHNRYQFNNKYKSRG